MICFFHFRGFARTPRSSPRNLEARSEMPQTAGASGYRALVTASDRKPNRFQWPLSIVLSGFIKIKSSSWVAFWFWWFGKIRVLSGKKVQLYWWIIFGIYTTGPYLSGVGEKIKECHGLPAFFTLSIVPLISYHGVPISTPFFPFPCFLHCLMTETSVSKNLCFSI